MNVQELRRLNLHIIVVVCLWIVFSFIIIQKSDLILLLRDLHYNEHQNININSTFKEKPMIFVTTLCIPDNERNKDFTNVNSTISKQIQQATTMIKSATILSKSIITFIIQVDNDSLYDAIVKEVKLWPEDVLCKLELQKRYIWFPDKSPFRNLFKVCASARLFFPDHVLKDIDSAIYVDTDIVFMKSPEDLWNEFKYFSEDQISGQGILEMYIGQKIPFYGESGLNSGVWMMNLTRMRSVPGGWENLCINTYERYKMNISLADQDIANIIFRKHPEYLYPLTCNWNFRQQLCEKGRNVCEESRVKGVYLLHGNAKAFYRQDDDQKLQATYKAWYNFQPGSNLTDLLNELIKTFQKIDKPPRTSLRGCSKEEDFDFVLLNALQNYILES